MRIETAQLNQGQVAMEIISARLPAGFRAVLSLKAGGDMGMKARGASRRRESLYAALGVQEGEVLNLPLSHSRRVVVLSEGEGRRELEGKLAGRGADGLVIEAGRGTAAVTVGDCMPIWVVDLRRGAFGLLHSGWKGTGILEEAVHAMSSAFGTKAEDIVAILGPSIGPCCYRVPEERARAFVAEFGPEGASFRRRDEEVGGQRDHISRRDHIGREAAFGEEGDWFLDLGAANLGVARRIGVGLVLDARRCTCCDPRFGSFRRQGEGFTRMLALAGYFANASH